MELSNTGYLVLGALRERPRSGYDIKQLADKAIRLFWAVSFGQLYPELKHLSDAGLIEAEAHPTGGRQRTVYRITPLGEEALTDWTSDLEEHPCEIRDEMLVRLFFSDAGDRASQVALARAIAERHHRMERTMQGLRHKGDGDQPMHEELRGFGEHFHRTAADWFDGLAKRLNEEGSE
ncbi:MAG TPA: helix-turn-helix transcriptional regulator [Candidatus Dormibacteraeota bacterium]|jgi:DNA-binding PadR family transcriptional regulator|nr:helix-turn-helix transcriptional regulator [Candidatus Dormibacteraeota bacterium]